MCLFHRILLKLHTARLQLITFSVLLTKVIACSPEPHLLYAPGKKHFKVRNCLLEMFFFCSGKHRVFNRIAWHARGIQFQNVFWMPPLKCLDFFLFISKPHYGFKVPGRIRSAIQLISHHRVLQWICRHTQAAVYLYMFIVPLIAFKSSKDDNNLLLRPFKWANDLKTQSSRESKSVKDQRRGSKPSSPPVRPCLCYPGDSTDRTNPAN